MTKDEEQFGVGSWIYCTEHKKPHQTGQCSVNNENKVMLSSKTEKDAYEECQHKFFRLYKNEN